MHFQVEGFLHVFASDQVPGGGVVLVPWWFLMLFLDGCF